MNSHPATYYHYEPLLHYEIRQARSLILSQKSDINEDYNRRLIDSISNRGIEIVKKISRSGALAADAVETLKDLMHCKYDHLDR